MNQEENNYIEIRAALYSITQILGLKVLRWYPTENFDRVVIYILKYLQKQLILSGVSDSGIDQKIKLFNEVYKDLMEMISIGDSRGLFLELEIPKDDESISEITLCGAVSNFMSLLYLQLLYNYSYLFRKPEPDCHLCSLGEAENEVNGGIGFNVIDPRPMNDGYEFGLGTQELWSDEYGINY